MKNIFYFNSINTIGGTEQFLYEIAKKYKDWDITIFYKKADHNQLTRLKKYVRCKKYKEGEIIHCKKAFYNFNIDIIDFVEAKDHIFVSHANYEELGYKPPINHPKLTGFMAVSDFARIKLDEWGKMLGIETNTKKCYNPLTLEKPQKVPILVSACRLDDEVKGGKRTIKLIEALDKYCLINNRQYLWLIFTNPPNIDIKSKNVCLMSRRVDVRPYISIATFVVQLSNDMETYCYTANEGLGYGVPIITTPLSIVDELPITDNEKIVLDWNCSNVDEVARLIFEKEIKPFNYEIPKDEWDLFLVKGNSTYEEEKNMKARVRCTVDYYDNEDKKVITTTRTTKELLIRTEQNIYKMRKVM